MRDTDPIRHYVPETRIFFKPSDIDGGLIDPIYDPPGEPLHNGGEEFYAPDEDAVSEAVEEFMESLYGVDRYAKHNDRLLANYDKLSEDNPNPIARKIDRLAVLLHDFVDHNILHPEIAAGRVFPGEPTPEDITEIRSNALTRFGEILDTVEERDELIKAYLYTIDASAWESTARVWRGGAQERISEMVASGQIDGRTAEVLNAVINKTPMPDGVSSEEVEQIVKNPKHYLKDLKLDSIGEKTLQLDIKGVFLKGLETLDLIQNPPPNNPASTYRDCTEALNVFVPALLALGYKKLAIELRGAALEWFFPDPNNWAANQHAGAMANRKAVTDNVFKPLTGQLRGIVQAYETRIKTVGSISEKLASPKYSDKLANLVPDGIGFAFIVPDDMGDAELSLFANQYANLLTADGNIVKAHPLGEDPIDEKLGKNKSEAGYAAVNLTFYYYPEGNHGEDAIPFEVQVMTQSSHRDKMYGEPSDLFYKAGQKYNEAEHRRHLDHLYKRAQAELSLSPGVTIESIAEMVHLTPEVPSVFNRLFRAIESKTNKGAKLLVPLELETLGNEVVDEVLQEPDELLILPPSRVSRYQFLEALGMLNSDLASNPKILRAMDIVRQSEASNLRRDGVTPVVEGHILPTALSAVMMAIQSGEIWENTEPSQVIDHIANIATIAILHDYVESGLDEVKKEGFEAKLLKRRLMLFQVQREFGPMITEAVDALTTRSEIEDEFERRSRYSQIIQGNRYARIIKPADRWQNHVADLIVLTNDHASLSPGQKKKIMGYFEKTDEHLSDFFTSNNLPRLYNRIHAVIWAMKAKFEDEEEDSENDE